MSTLRVSPLSDITNVRNAQANAQVASLNYQQCLAASPLHRAGSESSIAMSPEAWSPSFTVASGTPSVSPAAVNNYGPMMVTAGGAATRAPTVRVNDPYNWKCLPENDIQAALVMAQRAHLQIQRAAMRRAAAAAAVATAAAVASEARNINTSFPQLVPQLHLSFPVLMNMAQAAANMSTATNMVSAPSTPATMTPLAISTPTMTSTATTNNRSNRQQQARDDDEDGCPPAPQEPVVCRGLVQFKCHQAEYSSSKTLDNGQYVVVQGDRGIDIGVVIRINTDTTKAYVERTGPCGAVLRHATQREVDYWASELKADEQTAFEYCHQRVVRAGLPMEVRHAEYQFDKKKLTFYYDAKSRVDFVTLLKELYREFGCRIWMEKVRQHE